jgi:hypothetical protein
MKARMSAILTIWLVAASLAACGESEPVTIVATLTLAEPVGGPSECAEPIEAFISAANRDARSGRIDAQTRIQITADLRTIRATCETGNEHDAARQLAVVKQRYGYR